MSAYMVSNCPCPLLTCIHSGQTSTSSRKLLSAASNSSAAIRNSHKRNEKRHVGDKVLGKRRSFRREAVPGRESHQGDLVAAKMFKLPDSFTATQECFIF